MTDEPNITINGHTLNSPQVRTVRCAMESFASALVEGLGEDLHGQEMTRLYRLRISEIRALMAGSGG